MNNSIDYGTLHIINKMEKNCITCGKSLAKVARNMYRRSNDNWYCLICYRSNNRDADDASTSTHTTTENSTVLLNICRSTLATKKCIFNCRLTSALRLLTKSECQEIYIQKNIFVRYGARVCMLHGTNESFTIPEDFTSNNVGIHLKAEEIVDVLETLKDMILKERSKKTEISFLKMTDVQLVYETGLNHEQFSNVLQFVKNIPVRNNELALGIYLSRLRHGYTFEELSIRWHVVRQTASAYCEYVRKKLSRDFCNIQFSCMHYRAELLQHLSENAKQLYAPENDQVVVVFDGTYLFIQKSSNFSFQRKTYSVHKHRNLIKPMMAVMTDGYIMNVWGPYPGNKNDATILNELLEMNVWRSFKTRDVFVVDRGFRDCMNNIVEKGFIGKMPAFADTPNMPLTTEQANESRLVTKIRYIVEVINGRIKQQYKYFDKTIQNSTVPTLFKDFRIACALLNATYKPVQQSQLDRTIINRMLDYSGKHNYLSELVRNENLNIRRSHFQRIEVAALDFFPELSLNDLSLYSSGSYQIKQAPAYYADHLNEEGDFEFQIAKASSAINYRKYHIDLDAVNSILLKTQLKSRHSNSVKYFVYVLLDKSKNGLPSIIGHTCGCKIGQRVVGCCSHIATILWFFGFARHQPDIYLSANYLDNYFEDFSSEEEPEENT